MTTGYDAWVTREPPSPYDAEREQLRCACGRFLAWDPDYVREYMQVRRCDGKARVIECVYGGSSHDEALLAIIGEEHRGKSYRLGYPPQCKQAEGEHEINPDEAHKHEHAAHFYADPWGWHQVQTWVCRCGKVTEVDEL